MGRRVRPSIWHGRLPRESVLLAELNFERPRFSHVLGGLQIRFGVDSAIRRLANPADSVFSIRNKLVSFSAVKNAMRVGELKQHLPHLVSYLNWGGAHFDWLILDCPPVLSFAWPLVSCLCPACPDGGSRTAHAGCPGSPGDQPPGGRPEGRLAE